MFAKAARLLIVLVLASPAAAQETRAAQLQSERSAKATRLKPYEPGRLEKVILQVEEGRLRRLIAPHNGFFVEYGYTYKPVGSGMAFGGGWRHDLFDRRTRFKFEAGGSLRGYRMLRADFALPRLADEHLELGVEGAYRKQPQDDFYGLGPDSREEMRVSYQFKGRHVEGRAIFKPQEWLQIGTRFGWLNSSIGSGTDTRFPSIEMVFDDGAAPGLQAQPEYRYAEAFAAADNRDEPGNTRAGGYYIVAWRKYNDQDLNRYNFRLFQARARRFFPVFDKKRVFAVQAQLTATAADDGHVVPFFLQPTLGGSHTLRSVHEYRFRDRNMLAMNVEYRWEAFAALDMALFADFGKVAPRVSELDFSDLKRGYGIGFRFNTPGTVFFRIDIATGAGEGVHYYFKMNNAF